MTNDIFSSPSNFTLRYLTQKHSESTFSRKVFCTYHPDDEAQFKAIASDVLSLVDCAVFHHPNTLTDGEIAALSLELEAMSAFVLIVTSRFFFSENSRTDALLRFAKAHSIPILPILMEEGLEDIVNEKLGNLQCLSPYFEKNDATVLPFHDKLKTYFDTIFATDISKETLKAGFSASIFLSYRKKDRKVAKRLIDLIHSSPECRNIAIWYDEFLVPGEDFNQNIQSELEDSMLFVLAVTPFAIDGNNYIKLTEYPMATALKKPILPFEMEKTDKNATKEAFPDIPDLIAAESSDGVRNAIIEALAKLNVHALEDASEREYLVGLAYLLGVCVEKNYTYALELIQKAADADLPAALERLALIYKNGEGTAVDLSRAARYYEKRLALQQTLLAAEKTDENRSEAIRIAHLLAETEAQNKNVSKAVATYREIASIAASADGDMTAHAAAAFELAGKLLMANGAYLEARHSFFENALQQRQALYEQSPTFDTLLNLIETEIFIATCCEECDQVVGVKEKIVVIKNLLAKIEQDDCKNDPKKRAFKRLVAAYNALGHFYIFMLPLNAARTWNIWDMTSRCVGETRLLAKELYRKEKTPDAAKALIRAHVNEGDLHATSKVENHLCAALDCYRSAEEILKDAFSDAEDSIDALSEKAALSRKIAAVYLDRKKPEEALAAYQEALNAYLAVLSLTEPISLSVSYAQCLREAAKASLLKKDKKTAKKQLEESEARFLSILDRSPIPAFRYELAETLSALAKIYEASWDVDTAIVYLERRKTLSEDVAHSMGRVIDYKRYVSAIEDLISMHRIAGNFNDAKRLSEELAMLLTNNPHLKS